MALTIWRPARELSPFGREMDNVFDRFFDSPFFDVRPTVVAPALEVTENDEAFSVQLELAGVDEKDVEITLTEGTLLIKGEKKEENREQKGTCYCSERSYGAFERAIAVPSNVDGDKVAAKYKNGVLEVTLPKLEEAKPRRVEIK
ncbi:MAG TPA: Hsp20/alpha crystallin family protein [Myxococcota bacterium]|nr:Hsp20/alpha crystallin family protein [Myxococcota bacterium]